MPSSDLEKTLIIERHMRNRSNQRAFWLSAIVLLALIVIFAKSAGTILVVDDPQPSDLIVVLAGDTNYRPAQALRLFEQGYAHRILLNVPGESKVYKFTQLELAEKYAHELPEAASIDICPIEGLSTRDESHDVAKCLAHESAKKILIVTSDYHTRRALSIFRHEVPGRTYSTSAVRDVTQFGTNWWEHRQWSKTCLDEWLRLLWWNGVERWR